MHHNVAMNCFRNYGFQIKGFKHQIHHNTALDNYYSDMVLSRCYPSSCERQIFYNNNNSVFEMNSGGELRYDWLTLEPPHSQV